MPDSSLPLFRVGAAAQPLRAGDIGTFNCDAVFSGDTTFSSGTTVDFTGATVSGLIVGAAYVTDATGTFGFSGSAGVVSSTGISDMSLTGTGAVVYGATSTGTLSLRSATGTARFGDGTGYMQASGSGGFSTSGITTYSVGFSTSASITGSSTATAAVRSGSGTATFGDATGAIQFTGSGALGTSSVTSIDLDGSAAIQINSSGGKIQIGNDAVAQDLDLGTAGARNINIGSSAATVFVKGNEIFSGGTNAATLTQSILKTAGATLAVGDVLAYAATSGKMVLADANGAANLRNAVGTCVFPAAADGDPTSAAVALEVPVKFAAAPAASDIGSIVYLSETAGRGVLDVSGFTAGSAIFKLGTLAFADGVDTVCRVLWAPMFVMNA